MGYKGAFIGQALGGTGGFGAGLPGFAGALAQAAERDMLASQRTEDIERETSRFNTLRNDNFTELLARLAEDDMRAIPASGYEPQKGFVEAMRLNAPDGTEQVVVRPKPRLAMPDASDFQIIEGGDGFARVNRATGEVSPIEGVTPRPPAPPVVSYQPVQTAGGIGAFNPRSGEITPTGVQAPPRANPATRPPTDAQTTAASYYDRALGANEILNQLGTAPTTVDNLLSNTPMGLGRHLQSPEAQQRDQAGRAFVASILRKESGGAVTDEEFDIYGAIYLPMPGDSPEVLAQKTSARAQAIEGLQRSAGPALGNVSPASGGGYQAEFEDNPY